MTYTVLSVKLLVCPTGELGQHCWPTKMKCDLGEQLEHVYVMLPLLDGMQGMKESLRLWPTFPISQDMLRPHRSQTTLSSDCGLCFDITSLYITSGNKPMFCVEIFPQLSTLGRVLKCPPFLVTTWLKQHPSPF